MAMQRNQGKRREINYTSGQRREERLEQGHCSLASLYLSLYIMTSPLPTLAPYAYRRTIYHLPHPLGATLRLLGEKIIRTLRLY